MRKTDEFPGDEFSAWRAALEERARLLADYLGREREMMEQAGAERAERSRFWEQTVTGIQRSAWGAQLESYKSLARSMAGLLGGSIKEQAKIMIPFEIAEATKEFARFLGTRDPAALASSLKHALAAKQYAAAAKTAGPGGGEGGAGHRAASAPAPAAAKEEAPRKARVVVNVGRRIGVVDTYEFARTLIEAINENLRDDVVLEVGE